MERTGILGLRMAVVASAAGVSETLLYKYFGDRNGLLTETLAAMWHDYTQQDLDVALKKIRSLADDELTPEVFAELKVKPQNPVNRRHRWLRVQILAASLELPELRRKLGEEQRQVQANFEELSNEVRDRLPKTGLSIDARAESLFTMAATLGYALNDLLEEDGLTDSEAFEFWRNFHRFVGFDDPRLRPRDDASDS